MRKMRLGFRVVLIIGLFSAGLLIAATVFPVLTHLLRAEHSYRYKNIIKMRWLRCFGGIIGLRIHRHGHPGNQALFIVSNHISWLDILVLGCNASGCFIAKSDIADWPVIGYLARQAGTVFIRRGETRQVQHTCERIRQELAAHRTIIAFPEGTTTNGETVLPFHASLFQPALAAGVPVQPVAINYFGSAHEQAPFIGDDAFVPHLLKLLRLGGIEARVDFLPPLATEELQRQTLCRKARTAIEAALARAYPIPVDDAATAEPLLDMPLAVFDRDPEF
jgi:1-acyl-sn-glycerol-3-phosphate acyltransferase